MAKAKDDKKDEIKLAISEHLNIHGPRDWPLVQKKFPDVSRATFFRYIKEVRDEIEESAVSNGSAALKLAQQRIKSKVAPERTQKQIKAHLPASPSPAVIMDLGAAAAPTFDFLAFFNEIVADQQLVRNSTIAVNTDGTVRLKNPAMMDKSVGRRLQIIETWLHSQEAVWNFDKLQQLYRLVIEEVGKASPDVQQNILTRLRALDNQHGITVNARL